MVAQVRDASPGTVRRKRSPRSTASWHVGLNRSGATGSSASTSRRSTSARPRITSGLASTKAASTLSKAGSRATKRRSCGPFRNGFTSNPSCPTCAANRCSRLAPAMAFSASASRRLAPGRSRAWKSSSSHTPVPCGRAASRELQALPADASSENKTSTKVSRRIIARWFHTPWKDSTSQSGARPRAGRGGSISCHRWAILAPRMSLSVVGFGRGFTPLAWWSRFRGLAPEK